jgi:Fe-S-cluster containining protein
VGIDGRESLRGGKKKRDFAQANGKNLPESPNAYGRLFELGREEELWRTLAAKVREGVKLPDGRAEELISHAIDEVVSERAWGWHLALSPDRLRALARHLDDDLTPFLCAECILPGCCYFDTVRLTSNDIKRLSGRLKQSHTEFVAQHCTQYADASDRRYVCKLKNAKPCGFLREDGRCRVYADRPEVCAEFPFVVDQTTGDITEIRLFRFCNVAFNAARCEVARRVERSVRAIF